MTARTPLSILSLLLVLLTLPGLSAAQEVRFLSIIDGDSMLVENGGRSHQVRLIGIDAPEWGQEYGSQAKAYALSKCYGKKLRLEFDKGKKDRYGRLLAYVYYGETMLNETMVKAGMAIAVKVEPNEKYYALLKRAEDEARAKRQGIWLHGGLKQAPGEWRKTHKK